LATLAEAIDLKDPLLASSELVFRLRLKLMIAGREQVDEERRTELIRWRCTWFGFGVGGKEIFNRI